ncbi:N2,N2-dimethylguanosine tRNA methyltransferase [Cyanobium sp. N5-Cardenillas]|uniref:N2,N2-dimethylguanosine tRNA methyltransferase n=1 Tax=Cyanobium sp. N5-Cardenillas TaxID=2823720 RepID=UPI0020CE4CB3|nr:N2,N2-dimethylguanosine tRNA methyltransferase [Cyanobium sp. N5-Cardenillas]MCP9785101.1 N2,N2-dimethylguanosine tRNA methyltransferase [Cyanobium sp. N5-Cardenillas]
MSEPPHYCEGAAVVETGGGFFRPASRPARDFGVLLARTLAAAGTDRPVRVLDGMAGCGIRALRYGLEGGATAVWANDADPDRLPLLERNLSRLPAAVDRQLGSTTAQQLLAGCLVEGRRFELVDLDAFGCPAALVPLALEAVAFGGVLYLASTDGRSATGHDRRAAVRRFGAAARAHPASWEIALRLQLGLLARAAWAMGRGITPLLSFSEGRAFRTAVRLARHPAAGEEAQLGLVAHCHGCGEQQVQSLLRLGRWRPCGCPGAPSGEVPPLAVSGPLWIGPLQDSATLTTMLQEAEAGGAHLDRPGRRRLERLRDDPATTPRCWPVDAIARRLGQGPPPLAQLVGALTAEGFATAASGVMAGQLRSEAPWPLIVATARGLVAATAAR